MRKLEESSMRQSLDHKSVISFCKYFIEKQACSFIYVSPIVAFVLQWQS